MHLYTVAFQSIEVREVDAQVHIGDSGGRQFNIVGLVDKAVAESRERVRAKFSVRYKASGVRTNAEAENEFLERVAKPDAGGLKHPGQLATVRLLTCCRGVFPIAILQISEKPGEIDNPDPGLKIGHAL